MVLFEKTINELKNGTKSSILLNREFRVWFWRKINSIISIDTIDESISFGDIPMSMFSEFNIHLRDITMIGVPKESTYMHKELKVLVKPVYMPIKLETKSRFVFALEQINKIKKESELLSYFNNLIKYSDQFIFLTCWGMDPEISEKIRALERTYWDMDKYVDIFKQNRFSLIARANYKDSFTMLYVFEKFR